MASVKYNSMLNGVSGKIGEKWVLKKYKTKDILAQMPSKPRKRSVLQKKNADNFREASCFSKGILKNTEIKEYYGRKAKERGQSSAYTAAIKDYLDSTTVLTADYILEQARKPVVISEPKNDPENTMEIIVKKANGEIVARGFAAHTTSDEWKYVAPFTGLEVVVVDQRKK